MAERTVRSKRSRWLRRILGGVGFLLLAVFGLVAFLVGTGPGGRVALSLAPAFFPEDLHAEVGAFSGRLIDRFELRDVQLELPAIEIRAASLSVHWRGMGILRKTVHAEAVAVDGLDVRMIENVTDSTTAPPESTPDSLRGPPIADLPLDISFDSVTLSDATFRMGDSVWVSEGTAFVRGTIEDYRLSFAGRADLPDLPGAEVHLSGAGTSTALEIDALEARTLGGTASASGSLSWWPDVSWDAAFRADTLRPAAILPDPDEWPGALSLSGSSTGSLDETGRMEIDALVDTLYGVLRGERLDGHVEAHLRGDDLAIPAAAIEWGPATVSASGDAGESLSLDFEALVPDLGLFLPGSAGRLSVSGRATGPRDTPSVQASFDARGLAHESVSIESAQGEVNLDEAGRVRASFDALGLASEAVLVESAAGDLDLEIDLSGPVGAHLLARDVRLGDQIVDSATVVLEGRDDDHRLQFLARGPGLELEIFAGGGLDRANTWSGTLESLRFVADTVGAWTLAAPVEISASADGIAFGQACIESAPDRVCAEGELGDSVTRLAATIDSFQTERIAPLMPEGLSVSTVLQADLALEMKPGGEVWGEVELRTSSGTLNRTVAGESRDLAFEPIEMTAFSGAEGIRGTIELHVTDSTGVRVLDVAGRLESPVAVRSIDDLSMLEGQPISAHLEVAADDLLLITEDLLPAWDVRGSLEATADLDIEAEQGGRAEGRIEVRTSAGTVTRIAGGEPRSFSFEPIEVTATSGRDGLQGTLDLHFADSTGVRVLDVTGRLESPAVVRSIGDLSTLADQPVSAHLDVAVDDLLFLTEELLPAWDAQGSFSATAELDIDADRSLRGSLVAATESMVLQNTIRGQGWRLIFEPARVEVDVGPDGLEGALDLVVGEVGHDDLLTASGRIRLPNLTTLDFDPEDQPVDGDLEVRMDDLSLVEAFLIDISKASGSFLLTTRVGGTLADLTVDGDASLSDGYALLPTVGLELTEIEFSGSGRPDGTIELDGRIRSGDGFLTLTGRTERYPSAETPSVFQLRGERFLLMDIPEVNLVAEPRLDLAFDGSDVRLTGNVVIPRGRLGFPEIPPTAVTPSEDVMIVGATEVEREPPVPFGTDITVTLGDDVFFNGFGFSANLVGDVRIVQEPGGQPRGRGEVRFVNGTYRTLGQELRIEPGRLVFSGPVSNPGVDARAFVRATDGTEAGFRIGGTVQDLDVTTYSRPPRSDSDIMAYILFGRPMSETSGTEGDQASNAAAVLGANMLAMSLAPSLGLDEARIETGTQQNKAQLVVGKYLSPRLYVGYGIGIYEPISTVRLRYLLSARWSIEAITGDQQSTDLLWRIESGGSKPERGDEGAEGESEAPAAAASD